MRVLGIPILLLLCAQICWSQNRIPMLGESAPEFVSSSTNGKFEFPLDYGLSWKILFSHPGDFTPICTSEIMHLAKMQEEFDSLGVKIAVISTDDLSTHYQWKQAMEEALRERTGSGTIHFPLIADSHGEISEKYGMLLPGSGPIQDARGVFIIDPSDKIRSVNFYPMDVGRNMEEIKRVVVALQTADRDQVLLPVNWIEGDSVLIKNDPILYNPQSKYGIKLLYKKGR